MIFIIMEELKRCSKCREEKPRNAFGKKSYNKDGLNHYCRECERERSKRTYANPETKENKKWYQIKKLYGLTKEQYLTKLELQGGKCMICENDLAIDRKTHVDHCHKTGKVRDILCNDCNHLVGVVEKVIDGGLDKVVNYIINHRT